MASQKRDLNFNPDLFNNVFWHLQEAFANERIRYIWLYGGSSASKTFSVVQAQVVAMLSGNRENALVLRKYATDIRDSIYSDFKNIIKSWELEDFFEIQQNYIICKTGSYVRFRGLDDSEKVKGISNFKRVIMEEISQFDEVDLKQMRKRLRGQRGQQIIGIFNPISEEHWIKTNVFDLEVLTEIDTENEAKEKKKKVRDWKISGKWINHNNNTVIFKVNYLDNKYIVGEHYIDQHVIDDLESDKIKDFNYYNIYGLGNWGKIRVGGEFLKDFNANTHVTNVLWDEELPIHLSWDENVNPYLTCLVWQINGKDTRQIDEICLEDPRNRIKHVCMEFRQRYPQSRVKGLFIYGDRTSWKEDAKKEKGENFFTDVINNLLEYKPQLRLQSVNPSVIQSGQFVNEIFARNEGGISLQISSKCKKSIHDYQYALEDSDGTIKKTKKTNPVTKVSYEEFGHCFVGETTITTRRGQVRIDDIVVGDLVLTRKGFKPVKKVFNNGIKEVFIYKIGDNTINCTKNHEVFVNNKFISIGLIRKGIFCIFDKKTNKICYQQRKVTTVLNSQDTLSQKTEQRGFTLRDGLGKIKRGFTGINTRLRLVKYLKGFTFTTKTETQQTIRLKTSNACRVNNTQMNIGKQVQTLTKKEPLKILLKRLFLHQRFGTEVKPVLSGTGNTQSIVISGAKHTEMLCVQYAQVNSRQKQSTVSSAQTIVSPNIEEEAERMTRKGSASVVKRSILPTNILKKGRVVLNVQESYKAQVYDLMIEDCHEYFANGVLVHNCLDSLRYIITMAFANEYQNYLKGGRAMRIGVGKNTSKHRY